jgi:group I intron endonuclease
MYIYKITNTVNGHWYIGKTNGRDPNYMGSGKILKQAYIKHGKENFIKEILETCSTIDELNLREQYWISTTNAATDPNSYNLAAGGEGGDLSKFHDYENQDFSNYRMEGARRWFDSLSEEEKIKFHATQATNRSKGWYVSRIDDPTEIFVQNISKWCEEHGVDKAMPTALNKEGGRLFQKQTKGWRIRRSDMPALDPYENLRGQIIVPNGCKGRSWKIVNDKRIWLDKYTIVKE